MKIYTGFGDSGTTSLARGTEVAKDDIRVETYGTIDELNSFIGLLSSYIEDPFLEQIQKKLFQIGGYFANENADSSDITAGDIATLESQIDFFESQLVPLRDFILPRGNLAVCLCHVCRTICRRAERRMIALRNSLGIEMELNPFIYINRLSDYFFVLARRLTLDDEGVRYRLLKYD